MNLKLAQTLRHYDTKNLPKDILAGLIIMAVSIPISMGYAQIAGLPAVYGLYGSVFPIILFAMVFHIAAVYFWRGCCSGSVDRFCTSDTSCGKRFQRSNGSGAGADTVCGAVGCLPFMLCAQENW